MRPAPGSCCGAAGTIHPAQLLVIGAGVAGLQAIVTACRLGAIVEAYDVRSAVRDRVKSLGAKFVETGVAAEGEGGCARELTVEERRRQREVLDDRIAAADRVITTAGVPGRPAPRIISREAVERMKPGAVIVDLLAEGELAIDWDDEVFTSSCVTHGGKVRHEPTAKLLGGG